MNARTARYLDLLFFTGFALLVCHELDAVGQAEWRLLPLLSGMPDADAYRWFVILHVPDGHHLQNRSQAEATFLFVGSRNDEDYGKYSDIDMAFGPGRYSRGKAWRYQYKNGTPY